MDIDQLNCHAVLTIHPLARITNLTMKPPIAILFANLKGNIGDFAILHAILLDLSRKFPGQALHVFPHGHHDIDERRLTAFKELSQVEFEIGGRTYFSDAEPTLLERSIRLFGLWPIMQAHLIRSLAERVATHASLFRNYDAIFLAGGEHWGGTRGGISMFGTLNAVYRHNDQIYAYPFSVNPRMSSFNSSQALLGNFRNIQEPLVVRDSMSKTVLDELGLDPVLGVDSVYSMQSLADDIEPMENRDRSRIIFALTGSRGRFGADLRTALRRVGASGNRIALMTTCESEDGNYCKAIANEFSMPYYAPLTWQEAVAEIKASSLLVTNRLHGLIFGSLANTPLLPVANRKKAQAFVRDTQVPHSVSSPLELSRALLEICLADRDMIIKKVKGYQERALNAAHGPILPALNSRIGDVHVGTVEITNSRGRN